MSNEVKLTAKEKVYDEQISPLVAKIIDISEKHGLALAMHFDISGPEAPNLVVSSLIPDENAQVPHHWFYQPIATPAQDLEPANDRPNSGSTGAKIKPRE